MKNTKAERIRRARAVRKLLQVYLLLQKPGVRQGIDQPDVQALAHLLDAQRELFALILLERES